MINIYSELAEPSRRRILAELRSGPRTVSELVEATGLKQPNVSNHLSRMRARSTVRASRVGRLVYYAFASPEVESIVRASLTDAENNPQPVKLDEIAKSYAESAIAGNEAECLAMVDRAVISGHDLLSLYEDVIGPAMRLVGEMWTSDQIDVAEEHIATYITERVMSHIVHIYSPHRKIEELAIIGCPPNSWHTLGPRMLSDYLRIQGWRTLFVGANVPHESLLRVVKQQRPRLVLLSCSAIDGIEPAVDAVNQLAELREDANPFTIGLGGWCVYSFPERFKEAKADFTAPGLRAFAEQCLTQIERGQPVPSSCAFPASLF